MTSKENFYFAGQCLALDEHPGFKRDIIRAIESGSINWEDFISLCSNHLILSVIYLKFKSHGLLTSIPKAVNEFLNEIYGFNLSRNHQIQKQLEEIIQILNEHGIVPTLLKGAGNLADHLYSDVGERMMRDIDLLVAENDYLTAAHLLESAGYSSSPTPEAEAKDSTHYPGFSRADVEAVVEIHWIPVNQKYTKYYNTKIIDSEKKSVDDNASCYVLSDHHKVIHNFIHSQFSHRGDADGIVSLRDVYDLYLLSNRVSVASTLPAIQRKAKAISYFIFAGKALGLPRRFYAGKSIPARLFCLKHDLNQSSVVFYHTHRWLRFLYEKIILGYSRQIIQSFYSKEMRQSVFKRIGNPLWYKTHLDSYTGFFSSGK